MAAGRFIVGPYFPARDRDGVLQAGALLYVFENGTTTKATIYTDEAMTVLSSNPVVANASGQFPAVWGEAGTADVPVPYTVMVTTSDGASLGNPSTFDDFYPSLNWENANITLAEAAAVAADASADAAAVSAAAAAADAVQTAADLAEIESIAANAADAPSIVNKANRNGDNVSGSNATAFRTALGAASTASLAAETGSSLIGFLQAGTGAVARTAASKLQEVISVADFGALGDGTDQTTALVAAYTRAKTLAEAGTPVRLVYPFGGDYRTSATLPLPDASEWEVVGYGHPEITCTGTNIPVHQMIPTASRFGFKIAGLVIKYSVAQPSTNTRSVGVEFHVTADLADGLYDFALDDLRFDNCYRGVAVSAPAITAAYNFPTWAFTANRIRGFSNMSGSVLCLGNFGSSGGSPCALITGFRSQCPNSVEPALRFSRLSQIVIIAPEILQHVNRAIQFSTCRNPLIQNIRLEFPTINTLNSEMIVSDGAEGYVRVDGIEIQAPTIAVGGGNFGYVISAFTARIIVSGLILKTPTVTSGTLVMLWPRSGGTFTVDGKPTFDTPGTSVMYRGVDAASISFSDAQDDRFWTTAIGASVAYANIDNGSPTKSCVMGRSGVVLGQYVKTSAAVSAGTLNSRIQLRGTTLAAATVTMTSGTTAAGYVTPGNDPTDGSASYFSAGDSLTVQLQTDGSFSPTPNVDVTVLVAYF